MLIKKTLKQLFPNGTLIPQGRRISLQGIPPPDGRATLYG